MKFTGYYAGWNRCEGCGLTLQKVGDNLRHKSGDKSKHDLVLRKKAENKLRENRIQEQTIWTKKEGWKV